MPIEISFGRRLVGGRGRPGASSVVGGGASSVVEGGASSVVEGGASSVVEGGVYSVVEGGASSVVEGGASVAIASAGTASAANAPVARAASSSTASRGSQLVAPTSRLWVSPSPFISESLPLGGGGAPSIAADADNKSVDSTRGEPTPVRRKEGVHHPHHGSSIRAIGASSSTKPLRAITRRVRARPLWPEPPRRVSPRNGVPAL